MQQAKAEQEEEFISNTLLKKIQTLKKEKEILAMNYEQEEEYLTNDLSKKLSQVYFNTALNNRNICNLFSADITQSKLSDIVQKLEIGQKERAELLKQQKTKSFDVAIC